VCLTNRGELSEGEDNKSRRMRAVWCGLFFFYPILIPLFTLLLSLTHLNNKLTINVS